MSAGAAGDVKEVQADGGFGAGTFTATQNGSERVRRYAICVGINKFVEQKLWANLDSACADAIKMHDVLKYAGYEVGDVLLDSAATAKSLRARITSVAQDEKCQCVFVFIATHGTSSSKAPFPGGRILLFSDTTPEDLSKKDESKFMRTAEIDEILAKHGVPHRVVVLDSCGQGWADDNPKRGRNVEGSSYSRSMMAACSGKDAAQEHGGLGVLTRFVLQGLRPKIDESKRIVPGAARGTAHATLADLHEFVRSRVDAYCQEFKFKGGLHPQDINYELAGAGDFYKLVDYTMYKEQKLDEKRWAPEPVLDSKGKAMGVSDSLDPKTGRPQLSPLPPIDTFTVGVVTVVPEVLAAVTALFDEEFKPIAGGRTDTNSYSFGRIGNMNVVVACLPAGTGGTISAAACCANLRGSFKAVKMVALLGTAGAAPDPKEPTRDVRLGDVVISAGAGVIQHDMMALLSEKKLVALSAMSPPGPAWTRVLAKFQALCIAGGSALNENAERVSARMRSAESKALFARPPDFPDRLFKSDCKHDKQNKYNCSSCDEKKVVERKDRPAEARWFSGVMGSSSSSLQSAALRDKFRHQVLCWETEAAGIVANELQYIVIRGIDNYCDGHINKQWKGYAAATAAATFRCIADVYQQVDFGGADAASPYSLAIIAPTAQDLAAVTAAMDFVRDDGLLVTDEANIYRFGRIGKHDVIVAGFPVAGPVHVTTALVAIATAFPSLKDIVLIGSATGADAKSDMRLGDVVISRDAGVIQLKKENEEDDFEVEVLWPTPGKRLLGLVTALEADQILKGSALPDNIKAILAKIPAGERALFKTPGHDSKAESKGDAKGDAKGDQNAPREPKAHYGTIAATDGPVRNAAHRAAIVAEHKVLALDAASGGFAGAIGDKDRRYLVVRGISDFDAGNDPQWRGYAAAAAVAYVKQLLTYMTAPAGAATGKKRKREAEDDGYGEVKEA